MGIRATKTPIMPTIASVGSSICAESKRYCSIALVSRLQGPQRALIGSILTAYYFRVAEI
jgi:hypothetical protein